MADDEIQIIVEEYRYLQGKVTESLEGRKDLFEWYFKAIALPAAVGAFLLARPEIASVPIDIVSAVFGVIGIAGFAFYVSFAREFESSLRYTKRINRLRQEIRRRYPSLQEIFRQPTYRNQIINSRTAWRGYAVAILNSSILTFAVGWRLSLTNNLSWIAMFGAILTIHVLTFYFTTRKAADIQVLDGPEMKVNSAVSRA